MDQQNENQAMLNVVDAECLYGGVTYVIGVQQQSDGLHAHWKCKDCHAQGRLSSPEQDCDLAIERCLQLVKQHHAVEHHHARRLHHMLASIQ